jgi:hypothetical protein
MGAVGPGGATGPSSAEEVKNLVRETRAGDFKDASPIDRLNERDIGQDIALKKKYATTLLWIMGVQIAVADVVFILYAQWGVDWHVEPTVMQFWLSATVVEVLGIVLVVTKYLFSARIRP